MSLRKLPAARALSRPEGYGAEAPTDVLRMWAEGPHAADSTDPTVISVYDVIGEDPWTGGGWTARRMAGALRSIGAKDVTVSINSPGGDMFEGIAIYNLLREHPAKVTVKVMGYAASAASIIAMAGDQILMGIGSQMMIHNAWGLTIGNKHDFQAAAELFGTFDQSMAEIYAARTGKSEADIAALMDGTSRGADGTWMTAKQAVDQGFADGTTDEQLSTSSASTRGVIARRRADALLADKLPRSERRRLLRELAGTHDAAEDAMRDAGVTPELEAAVRGFMASLSS